jgi:hypothetical protein
MLQLLFSSAKLMADWRVLHSALTFAPCLRSRLAIASHVGGSAAARYMSGVSSIRSRESTSAPPFSSR